MPLESSTTFKYYHYDPSLAGACVFAVLFGVSTLWHTILITKHRTWYFVPLLIGGILEIVGYTARGVSNGQSPNLTIGPFVTQALLLLVAPALFAASIYMILGRIIVSVDAEAYSLVKKRWLTKSFVISDVVCFFVQLGGGGLMASSNASTSTTGSHIILAGLLAQIVIFGFFLVVSIVFDLRLRREPTHLCNDTSLPWKKFMHILYITSGLIMVRNIVRVAEFVEGFEGYIILHEVFLFVFDAIPMVGVMAIFNIWYPSNFSQRVRGPIRHGWNAGSNVELAAAV